jgi:hypothetical protein
LGDSALPLWLEWSATCPDKFDHEQATKEWESFDKPLEGAAGLGSVLWLARQFGWSDGKDWLKELNESFFVAPEGSAVFVFQEGYDPEFDRACLRRYSLKAFEDLWRHQQLEAGRDKKGNAVFKPKGNAWLDHPRRRGYEGVMFLPGREAPRGYYNLWRGWAVEPKAGDWSLFRSHILENLCGGDSASFDYLLNWMGRAVQYPEECGQVAIVLRGAKGTGKGVFAHLFGRLFGSAYLFASSGRHLHGHFNMHLRNTVLLFADEALWAGDKAAEGILKALITEPRLIIEGKGRDAFEAANRLHIIMASNNDWVCPASADERRFFVLDVAPACQQNTAYFSQIVEQMERRGGLAALLHDLLHLDLTGFDVRRVPNTPALTRQKLESLDPVGRWWLEKMIQGFCLQPGDMNLGHPDWPNLEVGKVVEDYQKFVANTGRSYRGDSTQLGSKLRKYVPVRRERPSVRGTRGYCYIFPLLPQCRAQFAQALRLPQDRDWAKDEAWEDILSAP